MVKSGLHYILVVCIGNFNKANMKVWYSLPIEKPNNSSYRKLLPRLHGMNRGRCFYCNRSTKLPDSPVLKDYHATIDHVYTKIDIRRLLLHYADHVVLACYKCNNGMGTEQLNSFKNDYAALPDNIVFDICDLLTQKNNLD